MSNLLSVYKSAQCGLESLIQTPLSILMIYQKSVTGLTFYGGVNEIGGNKILLEDKDTRVFLDFGKSFSRRAKFFEEHINPRVANGIEDYLTMGLLPLLRRFALYISYLLIK